MLCAAAECVPPAPRRVSQSPPGARSQDRPAAETGSSLLRSVRRRGVNLNTQGIVDPQRSICRSTLDKQHPMRAAPLTAVCATWARKSVQPSAESLAGAVADVERTTEVLATGFQSGRAAPTSPLESCTSEVALQAQIADPVQALLNASRRNTDRDAAAVGVKVGPIARRSGGPPAGIARQSLSRAQSLLGGAASADSGRHVAGSLAAVGLIGATAVRGACHWPIDSRCDCAVVQGQPADRQPFYSWPPAT